MEILVKYDETDYFRPNRWFCIWASEVVRTGLPPTTDHMRIVIDLMLAGF